MRVLIVGGGAAGLFCAGFLAKNGVQTTIVEHSGDTGKKILITGKGRCNVTNNCDEETFLKNVRTNPKFLYSAIYGFNPAAAMEFFQAAGVPLKTERGRRVFPVSDRRTDIKKALENHARGAKIVFGDVKSLIIEDNRVKGVTLSDGKKLFADRVVIATGGLSYKSTGSTGDGYRLARQAGHTVVTPTASLVPLVENGTKCRRMMGLSLKNVKLTLTDGKKKLYSDRGEMLFTHFGISGPLTLSASCHLKDRQVPHCKAVIDLKPALDEGTLYKRVASDFEKLHLKTAANCLDFLLPKSMIPVVLDDWGIDKTKIVNQITRRERLKLVHLLKNFTIPLNSKYKIDVAVITSGGVSVKELDPGSMASKITRGLYFAGEVIDVDGYTGGYNLQIAFSTAYAAARDILSQAGKSIM